MEREYMSTMLDRYPKLSDIEWRRRYLGIPIETPGVILQRYQEKEQHLIMLSGCDMDKLIELFAAGYTLQPPKYERLSLASLAEMLD